MAVETNPHYKADSYKAFCYYFVDAPGGIDAVITFKWWYLLLHFLLFIVTFNKLNSKYSKEYFKSL